MNACRKVIFTLLLGCLVGMPMHQAHALKVPKTNNYQKVQLATTAFKTLLHLWVDTVDPADTQNARRAAALRLFARILQGTTKGLGYVDGSRDKIATGSVITHANTMLWQGAKDLEELHVLDQLEDQHGGVVPQDALKPYYSLQDDDKLSVKRVLKMLFRLTELGLSAGVICETGSRKQQNLMLMGQALCDLLLRFGFNDNGFVSPSWPAKVEALSSFASSGYDTGRATYNLLKKEEQEKHKHKNGCGCGGHGGSDDDDDGGSSPMLYDCPVCEKKCTSNAFGQMKTCKHSCCMQCALENKAIVESRERFRYVVDGYTLSRDEVNEMSVEAQLAARQRYIYKKTAFSC